MSRQKRFAQAAGLRDKLIRMSGGSCVRCGYSGSALSFHHRDKRQKKFCLSGLELLRVPWKAVLEEWAKCDLLCLNCHHEQDHG